MSKHFAGEVVGGLRIADEAQDEAIDARHLIREQGVHGEPIADFDQVNKRGISPCHDRALGLGAECGHRRSPINIGRFGIVHIDLALVRIAEIKCRSAKNHGRKPDGSHRAGVRHRSAELARQQCRVATKRSCTWGAHVFYAWVLKESLLEGN